MRLILELTTGPQKGARREIGTDGEFSVGTLPDAAWRLPIDGAHGAVWLKADSEGFFLVAEGNVTLEGHPVPNGSPVPVGHHARLEVAGHALRAEIVHSGNRMAPLLQRRSAESPTITSILSDVSPGGPPAGSALPGRAGEAWMSSFGIAPDAEAESPARHAGRPPALPDDWNAAGGATKGASVERANRLAQAPITDTPVPVPSPGGVAEDAQPGFPLTDDADILLEAFRHGAGIPPDVGPEDPAVFMYLIGCLLREAAEGLARVEIRSRDMLVDHDLMTQPTTTSRHPEPDVASLLLGPGAEARLAARFEALAAHNKALSAALEVFIARARDALDPDAVQTRLIARGDRRLLQSRAAACWTDYQEAWSGAGTATGTAPLSNAAFAEALRDVETPQKGSKR